MSRAASHPSGPEPTLSGVDALRAVDAANRALAKGFWEDAWSRVLRRPTALAGLAWLSIVAFLAVFAPLIANGRPLLHSTLAPDGSVVATHSPLWESLSSADLLLIAGAVVSIVLMALPGRWASFGRSKRLGLIVVSGLQAGLTLAVASLGTAWFASPERVDEVRALARAELFPWIVATSAALLLVPFVVAIPTLDRRRWRVLMAFLVAAIAVFSIAARWKTPVRDLDQYRLDEAAGSARSVYTLIPWSQDQSSTGRSLIAPGTRYGDIERALATAPAGDHRFWLGTDNVGRDVLACMLHACRLSISIGLVSTGIAVLIGVTIGSLMGYFGGKVDLLLFRVVETFMAIPVLFLLIVAAGVLPRNTYVMMAIIGCVTWTGSARFIRAEFLKLRNQDFVQSAKAVGLPLRLILFRHMLPNGVTPVLVDASFAIAAAITFEATLSFLGLGPDGQASWGQLLSSATGTTGLFKWWLATFPGLAIFLTVLSYNMLGEAFRDAIDPKLRKAAL
ncbi:MAG: ABC transporter permease [Phycisphaerae bacterium]|jgi:peptide/nickel transport system permease protein|nr:ABC transporter permease [Phycisphaerae bacterium]